MGKCVKAAEALTLAITVARDIGSMAVGFAGIIHQELGPASEVNEVLLLVFVSMIGGPAVLNLLSLRSASTAAVHTTALRSQSAVPEQPSGSPSTPSSA
jgi:hypothetical protein